MIRHEIFAPSINVDDVHHNSVYNNELSLAKTFVNNLPNISEIDRCPISGAKRDEVFFEKWGQRYAFCPDTWSLCIGKMPDADIMRRYLYDSDLARYRNTSEYQNSFSELRKNLWTGQVEWIEGRVRRYLGMDKFTVVDWGPRMLGWTEILKTAGFISNYSVAEPLPPVESSEHSDNNEIALMFDVIQRSLEPHKMLSKVFDRLAPGGILLLTCRSGSGFDVLTLAGESESIFPLDHLCLPSPQGMFLLLQHAGFEIMELTTPGLLDVQLVRKSIAQIPNHQYFQRYLTTLDEVTLDRLQGFLQQNNLSSHLRVVAKKPE